MAFFVSLNAPLDRPFIDTLLLASERCWGGTYLSQVSFMSNLQFPSFWNGNVFIAAEDLNLGCFWEVFVAITSPNASPRLCGSSSQNTFAEVVDSVMLLIYFSWSFKVYTLESHSYISTTLTKMWLKWNKWGSNEIRCLTVMQELKWAQMILIDLKWA